MTHRTARFLTIAALAVATFAPAAQAQFVHLGATHASR